MSQRSTLSSLLNNSHLLSNKEEVELVLKEFNDLMDKSKTKSIMVTNEIYMHVHVHVYVLIIMICICMYDA